MCRRIWPFASSNPTPKPSTPALLLMVVRFLTPFWARARIRFSGFPHKPNPPTMMVAPSNTSWIASSALATTLCIAEAFYRNFILAERSQDQDPPQRHRDREKKPDPFSVPLWWVFHRRDLDGFGGRDGLALR